MKTLLLLCTTLTFLEIFDVSITGVSALQSTVGKAPPTNNVGGEKKVLPRKPPTPLLNANAVPPSTVKSRPSAVKSPPSAASPRPSAVKPTPPVKPTAAKRAPAAPIPAAKPEVSRMAPRGLPVKSAPPKPAAQPVHDEEDEENQSDDLTDSEPTTIVDSSKHLVNTVKDETNKRGADVMNTVTDVVKLGSGTLGLFGRLIRDQTKNVHAVAKESFGLLSGLGKSTTKGAQNVLKSAGEIGKESANSLNKTLKSATDLGKNTVKLGGNVLKMPLSIGSDVASLTNHIAVVPTKLSKFFTSKINNTLKPILGDHEEENPSNEEEDAPTPSSKKPASKK